MAAEDATGSVRRAELLEAAYAYALEHGLADLSLRPLSVAIGSSPRVLLYLFGSKDALLRELLARARADELAGLDRVQAAGGEASAVEEVWAWLTAAEHRTLLVLWTEAYARSLVEPDGPWSGFAHQTVRDWLGLLGTDRSSTTATLSLAVLRGAFLDLLATGDADRIGRAITSYTAMLRAA
jgi:AcrR family transcriptional regulator